MALKIKTDACNIVTAKIASLNCTSAKSIYRGHKIMVETYEGCLHPAQIIITEKIFSLSANIITNQFKCRMEDS